MLHPRAPTPSVGKRTRARGQRSSSATSMPKSLERLLDEGQRKLSARAPVSCWRGVASLRVATPLARQNLLHERQRDGRHEELVPGCGREHLGVSAAWSMGRQADVDLAEGGAATSAEAHAVELAHQALDVLHTDSVSAEQPNRGREAQKAPLPGRAQPLPAAVQEGPVNLASDLGIEQLPALDRDVVCQRNCWAPPLPRNKLQRVQNTCLAPWTPKALPIKNTRRAHRADQANCRLQKQSSIVAPSFRKQWWRRGARCKHNRLALNSTKQLPYKRPRSNNFAGIRANHHPHLERGQNWQRCH